MSVRLARSFESLAQSMRVLTEALFRYGELVAIDRPEAIGNVEQSFASLLNSFHSLGDAVQREEDGPNWSSEPSFSTLRVIRNARHHNHANGIRTIFSFHSDTADIRSVSKEYLVFDAFGESGQVPPLLNLPISLSDILVLLEIDPAISRISLNLRGSLQSYMGIQNIVDRAQILGFTPERIFLATNPFTLAAGKVVSGYLNGRISLDSVEARSFMDLFATLPLPNFAQPLVHKIRFSLPE